MSEEKLKEIKDNIDFQERITKEHDFDMTFLQEEIDLYNEVVRLQQENEEKAKTYAKIRDEICDYLDSHRFCENFENVGNEENVRKEILGILLKRW